MVHNERRNTLRLLKDEAERVNESMVNADHGLVGVASCQALHRLLKGHAISPSGRLPAGGPRCSISAMTARDYDRMDGWKQLGEDAVDDFDRYNEILEAFNPRKK